MPRACLCLLLALLAGCSAIEHMFEPKAKLRHVQVVAREGLNDDNATALDLVFVYSDAAAALLPKTAPQWFAGKGALLAGLGPAVEVVELQMVPTLEVLNLPLPARHRHAVAVYGYANYLAPGGQAQGQLTAYECVLVSMEPRAVLYQKCLRQ
jgi:type VI secretion system protein